MPLTERDEDLLMTLVSRVRLLSLPQVADTWWHGLASRAACARRRLHVLAERSLVAPLHVMARPLPPLRGPLASWKPGGEKPSFGAVAWKLQRRWTAPPRQTLVFVATGRAARRFGGRKAPRLKHRHQATHDLGVSQVFLQLRAHTPARALRWTGEDRLPHRRGEKVPDALLAGSDGGQLEAIDFGGAYDAARLEAFHRECLRKELPYEIW
jgi:hypothetical protein